MMELEGRICLVTGASRGLGARVAEVFWEAGANVVLVARSPQGLKDVANRLPSRGGQRVAVLPEDLADPSSPDRIMDFLRMEFGGLDVLVNNAAILGPIGLSWENDWDAWQAAIRINLLAPVSLCRLCVPWMGRSGRGKIINLSGGGATAPRARFSSYATAKAGLVRFSETLAEEIRTLGIDVNCVAPGAMDTEMLSTVIDAGRDVSGDREYEAALKAKAAGEQVASRAARLCLYLASGRSDNITGKLISSLWDPWERLGSHISDLRRTDVYTLRRIVPKDRGMNWGDRND